MEDPYNTVLSRRNRAYGPVNGQGVPKNHLWVRNGGWLPLSTWGHCYDALIRLKPILF